MEYPGASGQEVDLFNFKMEVKNNLGIMEDCFRDCIDEFDEGVLDPG